MGQTKQLRMRDFLRFSMRNCGLHLEHIFFFKIITRNRTLLCTSNMQILKSLRLKNKM